MIRYIELVYDNSGSMNSFLGNKKKYELALDLFEKEILPTIATKGDIVNLRLLRPVCNGTSYPECLPNSRPEILKRIKSISQDNCTPLFNTVYDAVETCKKVKADEYLIFVLTDGDDTCSVKIEDLIDQDAIDKYIKFYKILLVQLDVQSPISQNNLTAFTTYLKGQSISIGHSDSYSEMRSKLKKALVVTGFSNKLPLEHCFDKQPGFDLSWDEIENQGIDCHQALLLFNKNWLSWEPEINKNINVLQLAELKFLISLSFKSGLPDEIISSMLKQLKKPYYYSHDCIYWDFSVARWKYFAPQNVIKQMDNPDAMLEDFSEEMPYDNAIRNIQNYPTNQTYRIKISEDILSFQIIPYKGKQEDVHIIFPNQKFGVGVG